jgi:hypothetical protein
MKRKNCKEKIARGLYYTISLEEFVKIFEDGQLLFKGSIENSKHFLNEKGLFLNIESVKLNSDETIDLNIPNEHNIL